MHQYAAKQYKHDSTTNIESSVQQTTHSTITFKNVQG